MPVALLLFVQICWSQIHMCGNAHRIQKRSRARRVKNNDVNKSVAPSETSFRSLADCNLLIPAGLGMYFQRVHRSAKHQCKFKVW